MKAQPSPLLFIKALRPRPALLALLTMVVLFFARFLFTGRILLLRDLFFDWYPWRFFVQRCLREGVFPLWNPYTGYGEPFLADLQTGLFYPPNYLYLVLPVGMGTTVLMAFHTFLAGAGIYGCCRLWRVSAQGSLLAAVAFCFSTLFATRMEFPWDMASSSWCPVALAAFAYWLKRRSFRAFLLLSGALCLQILAGYPEPVLYTAASLALYALFEGLLRWRAQRALRTSLAPLLVVVVGCAFALLLAMAQILPTWEASRLSHRAVVEPHVDSGSVNPLMLFSLLVPSIYGQPGYLGKYWAPSCFEYWLGAFYVGIVPVVVLLMTASRVLFAGGTEVHLARSAGSSPKHEFLRPVPFLVGSLVFFFLYAMGKYTPVFPVLWHAVPLLRLFRWPAKA